MDSGLTRQGFPVYIVGEGNYTVQYTLRETWTLCYDGRWRDSRLAIGHSRWWTTPEAAYAHALKNGTKLVKPPPWGEEVAITVPDEYAELDQSQEN